MKTFTRICLVLPLLTCACHPRAMRPGVERVIEQRRSQIVLLGTGTPNADTDRMGPATAIVVDDTPYLVDCGPGVVRRAAAAQRNGIEALRVSNLERVFITHLHSDHTLGLADLIFSPWVLGRDTPLQVYGPPGTKAMCEHLLAAYAEDVHVRLDGLEPANTAGYKVDVHEVQPGEVYRDERVTVRAIAVHHGSWKYAFGYRFDTPDRSIVLSGDCTPSEALIEASRGCDVLIHEVYSFAGFQRRPAAWQAYHSRFHTSTHELARIANEVRPGLLILNHQLFWGASDADLLREIATDYHGCVVSGADLGVY